MQADTFEIVPFPDLTGFAPPPVPGPRLRICIATEEIFGPVRNGGIASTYFHLARELAHQGHDVTICYLKGRACENETIEHWIDFYAGMGVTLAPLPPIEAKAPSFWQRRHYGFYLWLKNQARPFDVVHASEWRGGAYYALLAKRQGLAFEDTLFVIKASSPHIWNRHYLMSFLKTQAMLGMMYAEQASIELADMVIGGSAHLLGFMAHVGYALPEGRTYVQPNVLTREDLGIDDRRGPLEPGDRVRTREIAFFGRLEARKGLAIFCDALDFLVARGVTPERVAFLGKEAGRLPTAPDLSNNAYIAMRAEKWPFEIEIHNDFDQVEVLTFLTETPRLAVMPSLVENSSMAIYEALLYRVPFLATGVGGSPELVAPEHRDGTLVDATPAALAEGLQTCLETGSLVARCAFDNDANLAVWEGFHEHLSGLKGAGGLGRLAAPRTGCGEPPAISLCLHSDGDIDTLVPVLDTAALHGGEALAEIVVAATRTGPDLAAAVAATAGVPCRLVDAREMSLGEAWNAAAAVASGDALMFLRADIHRTRPGFAATLGRAFAASDAQALSCLWMQGHPDAAGTLVTPVGGDMAMAVLDRQTLSGGGVAIRKAAFEALSGFSGIYGVAGIEQDLMIRAMARGRVEIVPEPLYCETPDRARLTLNHESAQYMAISSLVDAADHPMKRMFLALGQLREEAAAAPEMPRPEPEPAVAPAPAWKNVRPLPAEGYPEGTAPRLRIALDSESGTIELRAKGARRGAEVAVTVDGIGHDVVRLPPRRRGRGSAAFWDMRTVLGPAIDRKRSVVFECAAADPPMRRALDLMPEPDGGIAVTSNNYIERINGTAGPGPHGGLLDRIRAALGRRRGSRA